MIPTPCRAAAVIILGLACGVQGVVEAQTWKELDSQGSTAERAGQYQAALHLYARAIDQFRNGTFMDPSNGDLRHLFGDVLRTAGLMQPPPQVAPVAVSMAVDGLSVMRRAETAEDAATAVVLLHDALVRSPWSSSIVYDLALAYELESFYSAQHHDRAAAYFEIYLLTRPADAPAVKARIAALRGQQAAAELADAEEACVTQRLWRSCQAAAAGNRGQGHVERARQFDDVACRLQNLAITAQGSRPNAACR